MSLRFLLPLLAVWAAAPSAVPAQGRTAGDGGSISGTVVAAATGLPLSGAVVVLEARSDTAPVSGGTSFREGPRTLVTGVDGSYRFADLEPGDYRLRARSLGYRPETIEIALSRAVPFRVSVGLVVNPIRLQPMNARAITGDPYGRIRGPEAESGSARLEAEAFRDVRFLEGDAVVLTHSDAVEAVTLGETDIFRALHRLPGVSARDDFTAAMWTRGAPWYQTRVLFDGLPLFNPVHAAGVFAGLNADALAAASFHPGTRSVQMGEGAAGVLNVESRPAAGPGLSGLGEVSVVSARGALSWRPRSGRAGAVLAARRSYVDLITRLAEALGADSGTYIPYAFHDVTARIDADLGGGVGLEASGLWLRDGVQGTVRDLLSRTRGRWGNLVGRTSLLMPLGGLRAKHTVGLTRFAGNLWPARTGRSSGEAAPEHGLTRNRLDVVAVSSELAPPDAVSRPTWAAGIQVSLHRHRYVGQYPRPYPVVVLPDTLRLGDRLGVAALWGERRWALGGGAAVEAGLRAELHRAVVGAAPLGLAPRLAVRATPRNRRVTFTGGLQRSWQYVQALAPSGPSVGPDLYVTDVWLLAGDTVPAIRSDVATLGAEARLGAGWVAMVNLYARRAVGIAVPEPAPGWLTDLRPISVTAENDARGVEVSARRLVGRWTMSASYSLGASDLNAASRQDGGRYVFPSPADRRHALDFTATARLGSSTRVGAAFTAESGTPYSRFLLGGTPCDTTGCTISDTTALLIERPNAERTGAYASLDLLFDWSGAMGAVRVGAYVQVRNVLGATNAVTYTGSVEGCTAGRPPTLVLVRPGLCDRFQRGIPILPLAGVRLVF